MLEHLIVDGYNILHAWSRGQASGRGAMDVARQTLLRELETAAAQRGLHCTVVFDGQPIEDVTHASSTHLTVLFSGSRASADAVIERLVCQRQERCAGLPKSSSKSAAQRSRAPSRARKSEAIRPSASTAGGRLEGRQRAAGERVVVATDDHLEGNLVVGWGAHCWSSTMLAAWLHDVQP